MMFTYAIEYPQLDPEFVAMCQFIDSIGDSPVSWITNYILNQRHYNMDELLYQVGQEVGELINSLLETLDTDDPVYTYCEYLNQYWGEAVLHQVQRIATLLMKYYVGTHLPDTLEPSFMALNHTEISPRTMLCTLE